MKGALAVVGIEADRVTFAELYRAEFARMVRVAWLIVGSSVVAEDLVQDAFIRVGRRFDRVDAPVAYLRVAVVNACRNELRRSAHASRSEAPERAALDSSMVELFDALSMLDERHRTAIVLRYITDCPDVEIAEILGVRPATVRSLVFRALKDLRREMQDDDA